MAIFSTVARPKLGGTSAISSPGSRPEPATMASTRSRVGGTTGRPSVTPRSKSASKGSGPVSVTVPSGLAEAEVRVVALRGRAGVVGVREDRDARGLGDLGFFEVLLVILEDTDALLRPLALPLRPAPDDPGLGQPGARGQTRAYGHHGAPDVLEGFHREGRVREDGVHGDGAVIALRLALVRAGGEFERTPRPRENRIRLGIPLVLLGRLNADALGLGVQVTEAVRLLDRVDGPPRLLARLPVGRELAHRALGEVLDGHALLGGGRPPQGTARHEGGEERALHAAQRPRRHQEWTR